MNIFMFQVQPIRHIVNSFLHMEISLSEPKHLDSPGRRFA